VLEVVGEVVIVEEKAFIQIQFNTALLHYTLRLSCLSVGVKCDPTSAILCT
jgi:hypothetical protein